MQRSSSGSRASEEFFNNNKTTTKTSATEKNRQEQELLLPTFDPLSHLAKKERSRLRSAENAIHFIPLILVLCAIILWFFSNPGLRFKSKESNNGVGS